MLDGRDLSQRFASELLGRPEHGVSPAEAASWLRGRRVLITGAGGSVGRPLAAAIADARPAMLALVEHHEASLWELHRAFSSSGHAVELVLADIRHQTRMASILNRLRPEVIFHLAAYKQVPFGEAFADEAYSVNVRGTRTLLDLAAQADVARFVYPSSDKACDPPSLYGATKRLAETLVRQRARLSGRAFNVARFVNILGTQGSVIELFARQASQNEPLTVTDPSMTRYWIGMDEALWLLLAAGQSDPGGATLLVDSQQEISVVEMARRVWRLLHGTDEGCRIEFSAPRPGERLRELLCSTSERLTPGPRLGLLAVVDARLDQHLRQIVEQLDTLDAIAAADDTTGLRLAAMQAAQALQ